MKLTTKALGLLSVAILLTESASADNWRLLNPVSDLPRADAQRTENINGASIHFRIYGSDNLRTIVLLHGGLGAIEDFAGQIEALSADYRVIAIDSRGHGRSSDRDDPISYHQMALDVVGVMDHVGVEAATIVGWSDGGVIGLDLGINFPARINGLFLIGTYYSISGTRPSVSNDDLMAAYIRHAATQYQMISATPERFEEFSAKIFAMWSSEPVYSEEQVRSITAPTLVAHGAYEEAIEEGHARHMAELIPNARFWLIDNASHFAMWQQSEAVNAAIIEFVDGLAR